MLLLRLGLGFIGPGFLSVKIRFSVSVRISVRVKVSVKVSVSVSVRVGGRVRVRVISGRLRVGVRV